MTNHIIHTAEFNSHAVSIVECNKELGFTSSEIGTALGYSDPKNAISKIFKRNRDELELHSGVVNLSTPGGTQQARVFNEKGVMLISNDEYIGLLEDKVKGLEARLELSETKKRQRRNFTHKEKQRILSLAAAGLSANKIGKEINRSDASVASFLRNHRKQQQASLDI